MTIVLGMAIDKSNDNNYKLTYEIVDLSTSNQGSAESKTIESEGKTIFDAIRNTENKLNNKLYFSHMKIIIISEQIAREDGVEPLTDIFERDAEPRGDIRVVISQEETAKDIITAKTLTDDFMSDEIAQIIKENKKTTSYTKDMTLLKMHNTLNSEGSSLVLPAIHNINNGKENEVELNGIAIFKEDKLIGYLTPEESRSFLFVDDEVEGGIIVINTEKNGLISLELSNNNTNKKYTYDGNHVQMAIEVKPSVYLAEQLSRNSIENEDIKKYEIITNQYISEQIKIILQKVQSEVDSDIFKFGTIIYKKDPKLWSQLKKSGNDYLKNMEFEIIVDTSIINTATAR